jgi:hypothetical protein
VELILLEDKHDDDKKYESGNYSMDIDLNQNKLLCNINPNIPSWTTTAPFCSELVAIAPAIIRKNRIAVEGVKAIVK